MPLKNIKHAIEVTQTFVTKSSHQMYIAGKVSTVKKYSSARQIIIKTKKAQI